MIDDQVDSGANQDLSQYLSCLKEYQVCSAVINLKISAIEFQKNCGTSIKIIF
jgi:hypothetical protein